MADTYYITKSVEILFYFYLVKSKIKSNFAHPKVTLNC